MGQFSADDGKGDAGARHEGRDSLFLSATFRCDDLKQRGGDSGGAQVRVRNLSAGGVMVELGRALDRGTAVEIDIRGIGWVSGTVAWSTDGRIGIAFAREIDPRKARKPVGQGTHTPSYAKAIIRPR
ncbi:hypothetical protein GCM10023219_04080 [Stakelama sediminis]|uniref:PilZ domain-containing protein n=1 Tax=Stakelama sediminis TaxID=463200 RepID=A0A840YU08_9SPHN|nr:PilZ domain-containing protein [Stakelama sediminis]MBB5717121.1 hypothetical protein [Stakelama sediminis]